MSITGAGLGTTLTSGLWFLHVLTTDGMIPRINDQKNNASALLGYIPEKSQRVAGKFIMEPNIFGRNTDAFSFVREGSERLPDPGSSQAAMYAYKTKTMYARCLLSGGLLALASKDSVRFDDAVDRVMEQLEDDLAVEFNRMLHNDGSGRVAEVEITGTAYPTLKVNLPGTGGLAGFASVATCSSAPTQFFYPNNRYYVYSPAGVFRGSFTVVAVVDAVTLTISAPGGVLPPGTADNDWIVHSATADAGLDASHSAFRNEPKGLAAIFNTVGVLDGHGLAQRLSSPPTEAQTFVGTDNYAHTDTAPGVGQANFQGVTVSEPWNQGIILTGGGILRDPDESLIRAAIDVAEERNNAKIEMLLSGYGERSLHADLIKSDRRYMQTLQLKSGWTALEAFGMPWVVDRHCPKNRIYGLAFASAGFQQYVEKEFEQLALFGTDAWQRLQDENKWQTSFVCDFNIGVGSRERAGFLLTDIRRN